MQAKMLQDACHILRDRIALMIDKVKIVGGGLAGSEAAWQVAEAGYNVDLFEMRPKLGTGAHQTDQLAELVCSNSLGSKLADRASGMLMNELRMLGSLLLGVANETAVPAGGALAVDRLRFSERVTEILQTHERINIVREEVTDVPMGPCIIASGPLTSPSLAKALKRLSGEDHLFFYDALAPIVEYESIDMSIAFRSSRYGRGELDEGDYINCPMNRDEYYAFIEAILVAERIPLREFEASIREGVKAGAHTFFEGCLPIEIIAERGVDSLAFGPMRPVGLKDPRTGKRPYAVVQLRQDDIAGSLYNLVGFQTNLTFPEQRRVLRMIPGLEGACFYRYGQMHRNTFLNAPGLLDATMQFRARENLYFAGQITGVEGYLGNIATGLLAGLNLVRYLEDRSLLMLPITTMLGALCHYIAHAEMSTFQPMKANIGLLPALDDGVRRNRRERAAAHADRADHDLQTFLSNFANAHSHHSI
jgi:methylenetetrahydrofolate--tRNA-(uracil-5-)-methyltransferase